MAHLPIKGLSDLLSELVAAGFERLSVAMQATDQSRSGQFAKVGQAYVAFAVGNTHVEVNPVTREPGRSRVIVFANTRNSSPVREEEVDPEWLGYARGGRKTSKLVE